MTSRLVLVAGPREKFFTTHGHTFVALGFVFIDQSFSRLVG